VPEDVQPAGVGMTTFAAVNAGGWLGGADATAVATVIKKTS
jgi:hypothetical protein